MKTKFFPYVIIVLILVSVACSKKEKVVEAAEKEAAIEEEGQDDFDYLEYHAKSLTEKLASLVKGHLLFPGESIRNEIAIKRALLMMDVKEDAKKIVDEKNRKQFIHHAGTTFLSS